MGYSSLKDTARLERCASVEDVQPKIGEVDVMIYQEALKHKALLCPVAFLSSVPTSTSRSCGGRASNRKSAKATTVQEEKVST